MKGKLNDQWFIALFMLTLVSNFTQNCHSKNLKPYTQIANIKGDMNNQVALQDKQGFIWFGNHSGVHRYNGYDIKSFVHQQDNPNSISAGRVWSLYNDSEDTLWLGTAQGLNRFNRYQQTFTTIDSENIPKLKTEVITAITGDKQGILWVCTLSSGLIRYDTKNHNFTAITLPASPNSRGKSNRCWDVKRQSDNTVWVGASTGLFHISFNSQTKQLNTLQHYTSENSPLTNNMVIKLFIDDKQNIWIGSALGLNYYHQQSQTMSHFNQLSGQTTALGNYPISGFNQDHNNNLWVTTWGNGLHLINKDQLSTITQQQGFNHNTQLSLDYIKDEPIGNAPIDHSNTKTIKRLFNENNTFGTLIDSLGVLWVFSEGRPIQLNTQALKVGINTYQQHLLPSPLKLNHTYQLNNQQFGLNHRYISTLLIDSLGYQWYGSNEGLVRFHPQKLTVQYFKYQPKRPNSLPINNVAYVFEDSQQRIWIGTGLGLVRFNPRSLDFTRFLFNGLNPDNVNHNDVALRTDNSVIHIIEDDQQNLWLATKQGLVKFSPDSHQFTRFVNNPNDANSIPDSEINNLAFNRQQTIFIGHTLTGLSTFNLKTQTFTPFKPKNLKPNEKETRLSNIRINDILIDGQSIWLATDIGLAHIDNRQHLSFKKDPLHGVIPYVSLNKSEHNLWIGTDKGMKSFNINSQNFETFTSHQGFISDNYMRAANAKDSSGNLYFAGNQGVSYFNPTTIDKPQHQPTIVIDNFLLANRAVDIATHNTTKDTPTEPSVNYQLPKAIEHIDTLTLSYVDNIFTFEFVAMNIIEKETYQYAYRLKGFNQDWIYTDSNNRRATFTNIPSGEHQFEVKAAKNDHNWSPIKSLTVVILPPWWRTNLAYTGYILLSIILLWASYRWRAARIIAYSQTLEQQVKERTETINRLMLQKDHMFANISHEFRTPLTLIINPIEKLINETNNTNNKLNHSQINKSAMGIKRNAQRLLRMVEQLLELTKTQAQQSRSQGLQNQQQTYQLRQTINYLTACFDSLFNSKNLIVTVNDYQDISLVLQPDSLEIILTNLLSNAIKYTPQNGRIDINIINQNNQVTINISDNGIGIAQAHQQLIFERFGRIEQQQTNLQASTGLGLALVKELVIANGGQIKLQSAPAQGSIFTVTLPTQHSNQSLTNSTSDSQVNGISANSKTITALEVSNLEHLTTQPAPSNPQPEHLNKHHTQAQILIIDDNQELRELIYNILSPQFNCQQAANGQQGIELAKASLPDLVISDLMMPIKDGFEVLSELKSDELTAHIPVILLTAKGDAKTRIQSWHKRADEYLAKPFNDQELIARIENLLAIRKIISSRYQQQFTQNQLTTNQLTTNQQNPTNNLASDTSGNSINKDSQDKDPLDKVAQQFSEKLQQKLAEHYQDENLNVVELAKQLAMSHRQFGRKTKSLLDMTPNECIRAYRLQKAAQLLYEGQPPSTIAYNVGFSSHSYFTACFKAKFGCTPSEHVSNGMPKT